MRKSLALLLALAGCVAPDAHAPRFAQVPYETFSRTDAVAVAMDEWRLWGSRVDDSGGADYVKTDATMAERQPGLWERVGEYWWEGMNASAYDAAYTGKHDARGQVFPPAEDATYAWSAAFISYVMRIAGAGAAFPYAPDHATYINYAARAAQGGVKHPLLIAENPASYAPRLGDLVCFPREGASQLQFQDLPTGKNFPAHCSIVVAGGVERLSVIGGNVDDAVTMEHLSTNATGELSGNRENWFVVLRVMYLR
ncbi:hypothetical protein GCM10010909_26660 [Acidocella aquatica]|uniref:DUF2272 domain-containing protein n=1 Tax=Acidocella aquatica TaxID=1922313 RepID=A0ABQ6AD63_9PROT|nr:DUF2272 domain-containing protein [Acidocella aquatica]GLR67985.1 hypothetical protein GCM10010909_26660 [Acidocella aquatica]